MTQEHYQSLLREFGASLGFNGLEPDEAGYCCLRFDETILVHLQLSEDAEELNLYAPLGTYEEDAPKALFEELLMANLMWGQTEGATLGITPDRQIGLSYHEPLEHMSFQRFEKIMERFVNLSEYWMKNLSEVPSPELSDDTQLTPNQRA